ncbi:hypothetical protein PEX1_085300 [Penicillium expansum]|uniref:Uncharacterized protein n=1 Tax=Penicillium expansum TaxID=27334 RepID=A0A0A2J894_PENEN|nr:hypothetical protein PEX2_094620 [Penicillium expansum]KGO41381.1 hypothetical protein PEXP_104570 [Penicillium expansum]KGO50996.1 hypothetical protein PEX2_094620 [Penicillium expansum]KGO52759.1 hypothetical protein PEX1_085300 [Penicillium expansum]
MTRLYSVETIGLTKWAAVQTLRCHTVSSDWLNVYSSGTKGQNPCASWELLAYHRCHCSRYLTLRWT